MPKTTYLNNCLLQMHYNPKLYYIHLLYDAKNQSHKRLYTFAIVVTLAQQLLPPSFDEFYK
jgi:hypothetical protein